MKFVLKENSMKDGREAWLANFISIRNNTWACVTPCYTEDGREPKYFCHLLYIARGDKHTAPRRALLMKDNKILKPVKYEDLDEKGHFGGEIVGTYITKNDFYNISIDLDKVEDML